MIVGLSSYLFDWAGDHRLDIDMRSSNLSPISRRVSRTATLDGGCIIVDNGSTVADATFTLSVPDITAAQRAAVVATISAHSLLVLSCSLGCFLGVVESVDESQGFKIRFLVKSQLSG